MIEWFVDLCDMDERSWRACVLGVLVLIFLVLWTILLLGVGVLR